MSKNNKSLFMLGALFPPFLLQASIAVMQLNGTFFQNQKACRE